MNSTHFLSKATRTTRVDSLNYWTDDCTYCIRNSWEKNQHKAGLWFRTKGCSWAAKGNCLMCNYSFGPNTTSSQIISYVRKGIEELNDTLTYLLISPSGSMLDCNEVPRKARDKIINILASTPHKGFGFETRPDTIQNIIIDKYQTKLDGRLKKILIGIETVNKNYQTFCLNKKLELSTCVDAFEILLKNGISPISNILLGLPFLTEKENMAAASEAILWSINHGADYCYLFPVHVKIGTPLNVLYSKGYYRSPSLWSLIEVMQYLKEHSVENKIRPSWYTSLGAYNVVNSPYTCEQCFSEVIGILDHYDRWLDTDSLNKLFKYQCSCRDSWRKHVEKTEKNKHPIIDRIYNGYKTISEATNISWDIWKQIVINDLNISFSNTNWHHNNDGCP